MPKELRERVTGVTIRFEDRPSRKMMERGVDSEALSLTDRDAKQIVVFLMSLHERYGKFPGDFLRELRRTMLQELATGQEWNGWGRSEAPRTRKPKNPLEPNHTERYESIDITIRNKWQPPVLSCQSSKTEAKGRCNNQGGPMIVPNVTICRTRDGAARWMTRTP